MQKDPVEEEEKEAFVKQSREDKDLVVHPVYEDCKFLEFEPPLL